MVQNKKCCNKGKSKQWAGEAMAFPWVDTKAYKLVKLPLSKEAHIKAMVVGLEATNTILHSSLCIDQMLPLVASLATFRAMLKSNSMVLKDMEQAT